MTVKSTRRAVLAGGAAAPVLSLPAIAVVDSDAELLALGKRFDELESGYYDAEIKNAAYDEAEQNAIRAICQEDQSIFLSSDQFREVLDRVMKDAPPEFHPNCLEIMNLMQSVQERIAGFPAKTLAGLKVKARSAKFAASHF